MECKPDRKAELLTEAFHVPMDRYKEIVDFVVKNFRKRDTVAEVFEEIRSKYKDDCEFLLAVFTLGRLYQGMLMLSEIYGGLKQIPILVVPITTPNTAPANKENEREKKKSSNGADTLWG